MNDIVNEGPSTSDDRQEQIDEPEPTVEAFVTPTIVTSEPTAIETTLQEPPALMLLPLDPAYVTIERIGGWIFAGCVLVAGLVAVAVVAFSFGLMSIVTGVCSLAYLFLGLLLAWATQTLPKKAYDHASWCLTPSGLEIRRGIWWRSQISVPLARVQHTDVHQGPLMRKFGLAKLIVHTAGTENSTVELNGLNFATAQRLRDALVENRGGIDGV